MLIAHITDAHVSAAATQPAGQPDTRSAFRRLVEALSRQTVRPDLILFSGDLGDDGTEAEYAIVSEGLLSLGIPVLAVPGNHDRRTQMVTSLPDMTGANGDGHLCFVDDEWPLAIIGLDTIVEGSPHGELCGNRLRWISDALEQLHDRQALIFMHHPPVITGLVHLDSMGLLEGRDELAKAVARHGSVEAILCGHMHRAIQGRCGGAPVFVAPSSSHQFALDLREGISYSVTDEPAQFMLHLKLPGQSLVSHTAFI